MRIVQLVESLEVGGLEVLAVQLALALQQAGHEVAVYCLVGAGPLAAQLEAAGIAVTAFHKSPGFSPRLITAMAAQLRHDRPNVLHGHNPGVHHYAAIAAHLAGVPICINTLHGAATSQGTPYRGRLFRWTRPLTHRAVFVCDYVRRLLQPRFEYPDEKCAVILNGIALDPFLAHPATPGAHLPRFRFGTVGRLVPAKGHAFLLDAFALVARELPAAELWIHGYGPLAADLAAQVERLGLSTRVHLPGRTTDTAAVLRDLDVFVFSSVNEGLPLVILEAMAAGLPIVSTNVGGIPEVMPDGIAGWLCPPRDPATLAQSMLAAARAPGLSARGAAARHLAESRYTLARMAAHYLDLYS